MNAERCREITTRVSRDVDAMDKMNFSNIRSMRAAHCLYVQFSHLEMHPWDLIMGEAFDAALNVT